MYELLEIIVATGFGCTVIVRSSTLVQPRGLVTVTKYVVVLFGLTIIWFAVELVFQRYVEPGISLLAVMVTDSPSQITESFAVTVTKGNGFTTILKLAVPVHPLVVVPVTVYVVEELGFTEIFDEVSDVLHRNVVPGTVLVADTSALAPSQISVAFEFMARTGVG